MRPDLFISRVLLADTSLHQALQQANITLDARSLVVFKALPFRSLPPCDWIIFTSPRGVKFTASRLKKLRRSLPPAKIAAIGARTARSVEKFFRSADMVGNGDPIDFAETFTRTHGKNKTVLFLQAEKAARTVPMMLSASQKIIERAVYRNQAVAAPAATEARFLLFTSPLNASAYFAHHTLKEDQKVLAIGATTAGALERLSITVAETAPAPDTDSLGTWLPTVVTPEDPVV